MTNHTEFDSNLLKMMEISFWIFVVCTEFVPETHYSLFKKLDLPFLPVPEMSIDFSTAEFPDNRYRFAIEKGELRYDVLAKELAVVKQLGFDSTVEANYTIQWLQQAGFKLV